jgi:hypothetical protein
LASHFGCSSVAERSSRFAVLGGAGGEHDEVGFVALELALAFDDDCAHGCPARLGLEPDCLRVRQQLDVRMLERRSNAQHVGV